MVSRPEQAAPRPAPRLYLVTPQLADPSRFIHQLTAALEAGDVAAVLLRLADVDERTSINCAKALAPAVQSKDAALCYEVRTAHRAEARHPCFARQAPRPLRN